MSQIPIIYIGDQKSASYFYVPGGMQIQMLDEQKNIIFEGLISKQSQGAIAKASAYQPGFDPKRKLKAELILILDGLTEIHPASVEVANLLKREKRRERTSVKIEADNERGFKIIDSCDFDPAFHSLVKD